MKVKLQFSHLVASVAGHDEDEVAMPSGATFRQLVDTLVEKYGADFRDLLFARRGQLRALTSIVVDGRDIAQVGGLDASIPVSSQVTIMLTLPNMSGG